MKGSLDGHYQCQSAPPISASQCHLSVSYMSAAFCASSVQLINATYQCLPVHISAHLS
ncbi:unnamed protein product, partial [Staurois parvus]